MTERDVGTLGEFLLGRPGVVSMVTLESIGVACAALPVRFKQSIRYSIPGLATATILALLPPRLIMVFACTMAGTSIVMIPALWLITPDDRRNRRLAAAFLVATGFLLALGPLLPEGLSWLAIPVAPVLMFGIPVGLMLIGHRPLMTRPWIPAIAASLAFAAAWLIWIARDHYYRLKY